MRTFLSIVTFVLTFCAVAWVVWSHVPCAVPVTLSIASIDPGFKVTEEQLARAIDEAAAIWEVVEGRDLFVRTEGGDVEVRYRYDDRQMAKEQLDVLDDELNADRAEHEAILGEYQKLKNQYDAQVADIEQGAAAINRRRIAYQAIVERLNRNGGASPEQAARLQQERLAIENDVDALRKLEDEAGATANRINALVADEQALVPKMNDTVDTYNDVATARGEEYETGLYSSDLEGRRIDLYLYQNHDQLVRLLAHELGHAVGMGHVEDPQAIMYRLNMSSNSSPSETDRQALKRLCRASDPMQWGDIASEWLGSLLSLPQT